MRQIITGFHAIEEKVRRFADEVESGKKISGFTIYVSKTGPRVKKILEIAKKAGLTAVDSDSKKLDSLVQNLPEVARDHRGIVLTIDGEDVKSSEVNFDQWIAEQKVNESEKSTVIILDSVTDPHNVGAIIRSCDQFGASLVVMPSRHSANDFADNEIISRSSAGASAYVPCAVVTNLSRAAQKLKDAGFWIYGADAGGENVTKIDFAPKTAIVMGSEGTGISRLLEEQCDTIVSIPTCGKIDSLNVSVAAGVLLFERKRKLDL
ncbi:23S rRNA (guanosine(2251)-2'-O)-methyltransferase RlmB [Treponema zioleckii]|uniref:23S rRNA (guanosine(2251)-2'-O)-methyltransferase RlmB n=1 Tax=Treponema zioleckii TaxID=331680 RepID=UPI00168B6011|nr:23S rRNA (guanosine(2251)-2'-O)-methyltransferase RlmB [Treponema zioleckii]